MKSRVVHGYGWDSVTDASGHMCGVRDEHSPDRHLQQGFDQMRVPRECH